MWEEAHSVDLKLHFRQSLDVILPVLLANCQARRLIDRPRRFKFTSKPNRAILHGTLLPPGR